MSNRRNTQSQLSGTSLRLRKRKSESSEDGQQNSRKRQHLEDNTYISTDNSANSSFKSANSSFSGQESTNHAEYKVDIEAVIRRASSSRFEFVSLKDLYPWISETIIRNFPFLKEKSALNALLNELSLFSTYKCMNEMCKFFTTDFEEFAKHAKSHDSNNYCSYCLQHFEKSADLCSHLESTHKFDRFQCNKCMYRSCQKGYVDIHQKFHHANEENCEVLKSPVQKLMKSDRSRCLPRLQKNREEFVMSYKCKTPRCKEVFYCKDNLRKHLELESTKPELQKVVGLIHRQLLSIDNTKIFGLYQCLHCRYGSDDLEILNHMALNHPHEFAYVCKRVKPQKLIELNILSPRETIENSTSIEFIGTATTEAKTFDGNLDLLKSETKK